jgi:hypothetical protein
MADSQPGAFAFDDGTNSVESFAANRSAFDRLKTAFAKDSWEELCQLVRDAMLQGVAALRGLHAGNTPTSRERYQHWYNTNGRAFLRTINESPECRLFGGALSADDELMMQLFVTLDRVLVDLVLLTLKQSREILQSDADSSQGEALIESLRAFGSDLDDEWERRFLHQLRKHRDTIVSILVHQFVCTTANWLVIFRVDRRMLTQQLCVGDGGLEPAFVSGEDQPEGNLAGCHLAFGRDGADLWQSILAEHSVEVDDEAFSTRTQALEFLNECTGQLVCHFQVAAHRSALQPAVCNFVNALSGLVALLRTGHDEDWEKEAGPFHTGQHAIFFRLRDPSTAMGLAFPVAGKHPFMPYTRTVGPEPDGGIVQIQFPPVIVPLDVKELVRVQTFLKFPFLDNVIEFLLQGKHQPPMLRRLDKAFRFWCKAEIRRAGMGGVDLSARSLGEVFLDYCMCIEILFGDKTEVLQTLSSRAATLIADAPDERLEAFARVKELYGKRSQYVHEGSLGVRTKDVLDVRDVARQCILYDLRWTAAAAKVRLLLRSADHEDKVLQQIEAQREGDWDNVDLEFQDKFIEDVFGDDAGFTKHCDRLRFGATRIRFDESGWERRLFEELL